MQNSGEEYLLTSPKDAFSRSCSRKLRSLAPCWRYSNTGTKREREYETERKTVVSKLTCFKLLVGSTVGRASLFNYIRLLVRYGGGNTAIA